MEKFPDSNLLVKLKKVFLGEAKNLKDNSVFHKVSLIAFFAWIGLGADGLSSSCYGPSEAFITLGNYHFLGIFVALGTVLTISIISKSYSQTIEVFPNGGGGYIVASKLHSPFVGMISGSALLIDYVLTISVSVASGSDALFSFLPHGLLNFKNIFAILIVVFLIAINLRGAKESVMVLAPIFILFVLTHLFTIFYSLTYHLSDFSLISSQAGTNLNSAVSNLGLFGSMFLIMKAFSMGAGTFTGIEAVSNGIPILREPKVRTAHKTMLYMAVSLAFMAMGLMIAYLLFNIKPVHGKTLNAVLFEVLAKDWGYIGSIFVYLTLISEAAILFVAAQAGFLDGPRILSNMAADRWMPSRFSLISDKLVAKNGTLIIGLTAILVIILSRGRVEFLIILYSINVFITFILTESGMVKHWLSVKKTEKKWKKRLSFHIIALTLDIFILISVVTMKFFDGGWLTLFFTGLIVLLAVLVRKHYAKIGKKVKILDEQLIFEIDIVADKKELRHEYKMKKTAVILVNGYNGLGIHTLLKVIQIFGKSIKKFIFVQIGVINSSNFRTEGDYEKIEEQLEISSNQYKELMQSNGFESENITSIGVDIISEIEKVMKRIKKEHPDIIVFSGQLVMKKETLLNRILDNNIVFSLQRRMFDLQIPYMVIPIKI